jgi:tRNA dimethylallyltransferase
VNLKSGSSYLESIQLDPLNNTCEQETALFNQQLRANVIILSGPTAVGKTELSISLAERLDAEIVSADSMQVYRGMDIGTAKPSWQQRNAIKHHMIDTRDVKDMMNVAQYCQEAIGAIESICQQGKIPIIVGGSGFYLSALMNGPPSGPAADPNTRALLEFEMQKLGPEALHHYLTQIDPEYAATITKGDRHKIIRAFEIIILTKNKVSYQSRYSKSLTSSYHFHCYFLHRPREILYQRINQRCDDMIDQGLIEETKELISCGLMNNSSAANAIGYRQSLHYLQNDPAQIDMDFFRIQFKQASRHYAKRQFTWFRKEPNFEWYDLNDRSHNEIIQLIASSFS